MNSTRDAVDDLLTDPAFFDNPYPAYARLRETAPVAWSDAWGGWVLTRYDDVAAILRNHKSFSSAGRIRYILDRLPDDVRAETAPLEAHYAVGIAHADPPAHTRLRAILTPFFAPRLLERMRSRIQEVAQGLVEAAAAKGELDLMRDLAYPLPAIIVLEMLGAPTADADLLRQWALDVNLLFAGGGRCSVESMRRAQVSLVEMRAYVGELIDERRHSPRDDLLSHLTRAEHEGERLSHDELVSTCVTLFVAGHETTTNLIGNGLVALLRNPEQMARLRREPNLMDSAAEELLRYDTPVQRSWRIATEETTVRGQAIRAGEMLLVMIGAAHRDPAVFARADDLDLGRKENRHLGFGLGIHFCLGAPLARIEVPEALRALLRRFPSIELAESQALVWRPDVALRGVERLPVIVEAA